MKTFIVYDLDSKMPVAVGEQVSAETARYCAGQITGTFYTNLFAEEIDLAKKITTSYPDRQAFFEKLALSLAPQPAIKIKPAPMPSAEHQKGLRVMRKTVPTQRLSTAQRSMGSGR